MSPAQTLDTLIARGPEAFEDVYADAHGDPALVPWADERAHPALVNWLNAVASGRIRCGARVAVVGCGLGHDARELAHRGYDVTAFDCSRTAINWAQSLHPDLGPIFHVADLFDLPGKWRHRFDLVVEINTIQAMPMSMREQCLRPMAELLSPHGELLVICRGTEEPAADRDGPPWPMTERELLDAAATADLSPDGPVSSFLDSEVPPVRRMRAVFSRVTSNRRS